MFQLGTKGGHCCITLFKCLVPTTASEVQKAVKKAAKIQQVEEDIALALEKLVDMEEAATAMRKALLRTEVLEA